MDGLPLHYFPRLPISTLDDTEPSQVVAASEGGPDAAATIDTARQHLARRYARQRHVLSLVNFGLTTLAVAVLLFTSLGFALRDALAGLSSPQPVPGWQPLRIGGYFLVLALAGFLVSLPFSYYGGFVLAHRYGISTQRRRDWMADTFKGLLLSLIFELMAVEFVYALLALTPTTWWLWAALAVLFFTALLANLGPVLLLPLFYQLTPLPEGDVRERTLALAALAHTRVHSIYSMNLSKRTTAANAMVMGLGNTRRIVLGDTLLDRYTPDEIEVVVAHELGHQVHGDIPQMIVVQSVVTLGGLFLVNLALRAVVAHVPGYTGLADAATLPLLGAALAIFALVTLPLTNGFSRRAEYRADVYALETTSKPEAFVSAMTRLANQNLAELEPSRIIEILLYNHPATGRRIALGQRYAAQRQT